MTSNAPIAIAILGAGRWGRHLIRNFHQIPDARVLAVVDPDRERRAAVAAEVGLDDAVTFCDSWDELRDRADLADLRARLDAIVVVTPAVAHYATISEALNLGYHVFSEKPLTLDAVECRELCDLAKQQQRQLFVDHTYLFNPAVQRGGELVRSGAIGELRYGYAARVHLAPVRLDVDVVWDLVIHDLSILNHWLGETPRRISAIGQSWLQPQPPEGSADLFPNGLADASFIRLVYPSGVSVQVHLSWFNPHKQRRLAIAGSLGTLVFDELADSPLTLHRGHMKQQASGFFEPVDMAIEPIALEPGEPLRAVCEEFLASVRSGTPSAISSGEVGAELVAVLQAISRSVNADGAWVEL
ncbi:MAG: Gfo/Idh/MocA family protein [Geitlerinemataceae cyanobacterium]